MRRARERVHIADAFTVGLFESRREETRHGYVSAHAHTHAHAIVEFRLDRSIVNDDVRSCRVREREDVGRLAYE